MTEYLSTYNTNNAKTHMPEEVKKEMDEKPIPPIPEHVRIHRYPERQTGDPAVLPCDRCETWTTHVAVEGSATRYRCRKCKRVRLWGDAEFNYASGDPTRN